MTAKADYIAARESESLSYGDILYAQEQGWCGSSPDGMGPHIPDDTTDPVTCAECGATIWEEPYDEMVRKTDALYAVLAELIERGQATDAERAEYARLREARA